MRHLHECFLPSVWRFVYVRVNGDSHLTEDIVSETVLALLRAVRAESEIGNLSGWLRGVASHKLNDHFRAAARVQHLMEQASRMTESADHNDAVQQQELQERRGEIRRVMDTLSDQQQIALEWKYIEKLSVREIAARMDLTEKAVESILFRARRDFKEKLVRLDHNSRPPSERGSSDEASADQETSESDGEESEADEDLTETKGIQCFTD